MTLWSRPGYLAVTSGVLALAAVGAGSLGLARWRELLPALGLAWGLQAPSYWLLAGRLGSGGSIMGVWVGGIAARLAGIPLVAVVGTRSALSRVDLLVAYVSALLGLVLLEALWLQRRS